jgi:hypothetical protein
MVRATILQILFNAAFMKSCFPSHEKAKATDLVFTRLHLDPEN